jgi:hypothetical protein
MVDRRQERRRDERLLLALPVALLRGKRRVPLHAADVSFRGLFLRMDSPPAVHQLLQIEVVLPPSDSVVVLHARVIRTVLPGQATGAVPGAGVEFHALGGETKSAWEGFVRKLMPRGRPSSVAAPVAGGHGARRFERDRAELRLLVASVSELRALLATRGEDGGVFVATALALPVARGLRVTVVHPLTTATHAVECVVGWRDAESTPAGVGIALDRMNEERRTAFRDFIGDEPPLVSASVHDVEQALVEQWEEEEPTNVRPLPKP